MSDTRCVVIDEFAFVYVFSKHREKNLELYVRLANEKDDNEARQIISDSFIFV